MDIESDSVIVWLLHVEAGIRGYLKNELSREKRKDCATGDFSFS